ncbi:Hypothetical protein PFR_JS12-1_1388 [Propionibacterium freudenreichii]|jgi:hypothetical protein|uniref:hypothetical protein n=1 Tax=Propionibacterium freudenreichii TaxID=1744 RepID=UPI000BC361D9|nr:hypothetical protein [Propionibacterium freudenreichii]SBN95770.1 Hypothetical protein PFR_JS12-2_1386 [Propionibacterium freudenreichii]SCC97356.1 Hypothetical protein PFR_JS12-1_1388 [Propionibacterium freudenreichii]
MSNLQSVQGAPTWDERIAEIQRLPNSFGTDALTGIYAEIGRTLYVPYIAPDFAYVPRDANYELPAFRESYRIVHDQTNGFAAVSEQDLVKVLLGSSRALLALRTITGLLPGEFASVTGIIGQRDELTPASVGQAKIKSCESKGTALTHGQAVLLARTIDELMRGLFSTPPPDWQSKQAKPDTDLGWASVAQFAAHGVPYDVFLHQRHYGGSFLQLSNATSGKKGDVLEHAVSSLLSGAGVPFLQVNQSDQSEIVRRFGVTVTPAPDFVIHDEHDQLRAMIECKSINDGGTARDKASRFTKLRVESQRLGGPAVIAVLDGLGWTRVTDALGPVIRDTDGRVFTTETLPALLEIHPVSGLRGKAC